MLQLTRCCQEVSGRKEKLITEMKHPPYSTDLAPYDFWLFPEIKSALKGRRFQDIEDIQINMRTIPQQEF